MEDLDNKFSILYCAREKIDALKSLTYVEQQMLFIMQRAKRFSDKDLTIIKFRKYGIKTGTCANHSGCSVITDNCN